MRRAAEDGAGAVFHQHEIGDIDRKPAVRNKRVLYCQAGIKPLFLGGFHSCFRRAELGAFGKERRRLRIALRDSDGKRVVGGYCHERRAVERIRPGREDLDIVGFRGNVLCDVTANCKAHARAFGPADPVLLHQPDTIRPAVEPFDGVKKIVGIFGDFQEPLRQEPTLDRGAGTPAAPVDDLFIGKNGVLDRVPVDPAFLAVGKALFHEFQEHALFMLVIVRGAGRQLAVPVIGQAHAAQLGTHGRYVFDGPFARVNAAFHRRIFRGQPERVPSHGMKHIQTLRPAKAGDQIAKRIVPHMAHMDAPRRIGEHLEHVIFRLVGIVVSYETLASFPPILPFGFDGGRVVMIHYGHHKTRVTFARLRNN